MRSLPIRNSHHLAIVIIFVLQMIAAHYEEDPESFHEEIRQLDQLREVSWYAPC